MKTRIATFIFCLGLFISACEKDGDLMKVFGLGSPDLMSNESSVVLTKETSSIPVLALTWSESELGINNGSAGLPPSVPATILEISSTENFTSAIEVVPQTNTYSFTGAALNTIAKDLGFTSGQSTPMYFRIRTALGSNTEPYYSQVISVNVTGFSIDMSIGFIMNADQEDTGFKLYAPESNGEYSGFTGSGAWFNWYLLEGDGTLWGNLGVDGNEFVLSNDESTHWNFWYPGLAGCYYTTLSTGNEEWTATYIPTLSISGDVSADMTFDRQLVKWYVSFTTNTANAKIKVSGDAKLYNTATGTDDAAAIAKTIGFIPQADSTIAFEWNSASAGEINIATAGDYTLTLYLADPMNWTYQLKSGITVIEDPLSRFLYVPGIDDGISGSWTFNNYLSLVSEDDSTFAGTVLVNSLWGYQMTLDSGDWTNVYQMGSSEGNLEFKSGTNITAPAAGLYLIKAGLKTLTYSHTAVTSLSYAGLNDVWDLVAMDETPVDGVYASSVTINSESPWGCKLYLNGGWTDFYGGADGKLAFLGDGIKDDADIAAGTYDLIADLRNQSYVFLSDEVYVTGLNDVWNFTTVVLSKVSTGVYSGSAVINTPSPWGIQIHVDQSWNRYFGGSFAALDYLGSNITDDQDLAAGTYTVTVDFIHNTCTFEVE